MARPRKPLELQKRNNTKAEIEERKFQEENSKVSRNLKAPNWLNKNSKKIFEETVKLINSIEVLDDLDVSILSMYSDAYSRVQELTKLVDTEGYTVIKETKAGNMVIANPNLKTLKDMQKTVLDCAVKLGLNSIDRTKLIKYNPPKEELDEFSEFL
ncbi:phage terminase small subunit P27 family [Pseudostreptobacillus hongkongensis]